MEAMEEGSGRQERFRLLYVGGAGLFLVAVVLQFFLAGLGVFGAASFDAHAVLGHTMWGVAIVLLVLGFLGRLPGRALMLTGFLAVLSFVQSLLPLLKDDLPEIAALHPVVALAIFAVAHVLVRRARGYTGRDES